MKRGFVLALAALLGLQPALADGLTPKAKRELAARDGGAFNDPEYDPATTSRMFRVSSGPSSLPPGQVASRIKDIAQLQSSRDNQLVGYGLVIGQQTLHHTQTACTADGALAAAHENGANQRVADAEDVLGCFATVADITARDAIQTACLRIGAVVRISNSSVFYEWNGSAWIIFSGFGGSSSVDWKD